MNLFFFSVQYVDLPISKLVSIASYRNISIGDLAVLRIDRRLVVVVINRVIADNLRLINFPMVAQTICDDDNLPKILPILYYDDGYSKKVSDICGLKYLLDIFKSEKLFSNFIKETIALLNGEIDRRDINLAINLLNCYAIIPPIKKENVLCNELHIKEDGKLLIVEKFFTSQMKKEFYDNIALGLTERESLVKLRRKYPRVFSKILSEFQYENIYARI